MGDVFKTWAPPVFAAILAVIASLLISKLAMVGFNQWISALAGANVFGGVYLLVRSAGFGKWSFFLRILRELKQK